MPDDGRPVSPWSTDTLHPICPKMHVPPAPCDCGFVGDWDHRWWYYWHEAPGRQRGDRQIRRDIARGLPPRHGDEGWWCIGGYDERCPDCGDIERFDWQGNELDRFRVHAEVVPFRRRTR